MLRAGTGLLPFRAGRIALGLACLAGAAALWLSGGSPTRAATAVQTQSASASVNDVLSWGTAGTCTQAMGAAAFPATDAGTGQTLTGFRGCLTSNKKWSVNAAVTSALTSANDGTTIPATGTNYQVTAPTATQPASDCNSACSLPATAPGVAVVTNATKSSGVNAQPFDYSLTLNVPSSATGGAYSGGVLTFTATN